MKKRLLFFALALLLFSASAFDWPQDEITKDSFSAYFGNERGGILNPSLVFTYPELIKASQEGKIIAVLTEELDDGEFFPSTLGNAVFIAHDNNLISVYGNLSYDSLSTRHRDVSAGDPFAAAGNSAWQENQNGLELQILDTGNNSAINPKVLMPHQENELPLEIRGVVMRGRTEEFLELNPSKRFPSGMYRFYCRQNTSASPYRTSVSVNGIESDQISYDAVFIEGNKSVVSGLKKKYSSADIYPDTERQLLGEAMLTPGRATITLSVRDILGGTKSQTYYLTVY